MILVVAVVLNIVVAIRRDPSAHNNLWPLELLAVLYLAYWIATRARRSVG